ncbi:MAG: tRNA 4-thiouridine(8) synthase ThiI [Mycoplasma sp.]|nr:tRNA 4-thiouridine(8) synthase ThiI [Mycoplasma sp.]
MYDKILIRFGELSTKGKNKMTFIRHLEKNMKKLIGAKPEVLIDRMFLKYEKNVMQNLKYIFGISSWSPTISIDTEIEEIKKAVLKIAKNSSAKTFKISSRRNWKKFKYNSSELNGILGEHVLKNTDLIVNLKNPDLEISIEIRSVKSFIFSEKIKGLGGYPTGINGKVLHLISGGIDSPVAAFELMKRGLHVDFLSFITPPFTDEKTVEKVMNIIELLNKYQGYSYIHRLNYTDLMHTLGLTSNPSYKITLMRRSFYRIANKIAKKNNYLAISNGENIGQVASQTLESINVIQEQSELVVFRPILTADKLDTIERGIEIGTYEISIKPANESCELFAPKNPVIKPNILMAKSLEEEIEELFNLEEECIEKKELIKVTL